MSSGGGYYQGGRSRVGTKVFLNVYDLSPVNDYLYVAGLGLHHSGVEIMGSEYSFASGAGIFESAPKFAPGARFREQIDLGSFDGGQAELKKALGVLRDDFGPDDYNLIRKNCNHFANALIVKLMKKPMPGHVNRLADIGMCCSCFLPKKLLENAPVGDPNGAGGSGGSSGFLVKAGNRSSPPTSVVEKPTFQGSGARLGGSSTSSSGSSGSSSNQKSSPDDLTDRREKARKAALLRLELNQQEMQQV
jgi:hypothetical protein